MSLLDALAGIIAPHDCLQCGLEGGLLCNICRMALQAIPERCYRCYKTTPTALTCTKCRKVSRMHRVHVATIYAGAAKELVWRLKFAGARAAVKPMAAHIKTIPSFKGSLVFSAPVLVVPVPTATSRVRQRGYDQAKLLARELSQNKGLMYFDCLRRHGQSHQVGASRQLRLTQLRSAFRVRKPRMVQGAHILLVDDVLTTGATLEAAASTLRAAGAGVVEAAVFAQA